MKNLKVFLFSLAITSSFIVNAQAKSDITTQRVEINNENPRLEIENAISGFQSVDYRMVVSAEKERLFIRLKTNSDENYFNVLDRSDKSVLFSGIFEGNVFDHLLPKGEYTIRVYLSYTAAKENKTADYRLLLSFPEQIAIETEVATASAPFPPQSKTDQLKNASLKSKAATLKSEVDALKSKIADLTSKAIKRQAATLRSKVAARKETITQKRAAAQKKAAALKNKIADQKRKADQRKAAALKELTAPQKKDPLITASIVTANNTSDVARTSMAERLLSLTNSKKAPPPKKNESVSNAKKKDDVLTKHKFKISTFFKKNFMKPGDSSPKKPAIETRTKTTSLDQLTTPPIQDVSKAQEKNNANADTRKFFINYWRYTTNAEKKLYDAPSSKSRVIQKFKSQTVFFDLGCEKISRIDWCKIRAIHPPYSYGWAKKTALEPLPRQVTR